MTSKACPCGFESDHLMFSVAWYEAHRDHHLAVFPNADQQTRDNLQSFVDIARWRAGTPEDRRAT